MSIVSLKASTTQVRGSPRPAGSGHVVAVKQWLMATTDRWVPLTLWSVQRTGRLGLSGLALLGASAVFVLSTYLPLSHEITDLQNELQTVHEAVTRIPRTAADSGVALLRSLPTRAQMPTMLGVVLKQADAAHLSIDTGKYESSALKGGAVTSYQVSFPVTGPYPQVRKFIDATLTELPNAALSELALTRKAIGDGAVEAQIRLTVFTRDVL